MTIELNRGRTEAFAVPTLAPVQKVSVRPGADVDEDSVLVALCQQGDEGAFEDLVTRHRNSLYRLCLYRLGNRSDAEDAVQEAFIRAWRALPSFSGKRRFYPWLSVIAKNVCTDVQRKWGRCSPMTDQEFDLIVPPAEAEQDLMLEWRGEREILARAFNRLSERHREVLELREGRNWSYKQIAAFSGVEVSTVETLLFRARRSLKREFMTIARAEGALGVLLVPWYLLRRTLVRLASGARARRRPGLPPFGAKSASIGAEHPTATEVVRGGRGAGATTPAGGWPPFVSSPWFSALSGLSPSVSQPLIGSGLAAVAAAAIVATSFAGGGHPASVAASAAPGSASPALTSPLGSRRLEAPLQARIRDSRTRSAGGAHLRRTAAADSPESAASRSSGAPSVPPAQPPSRPSSLPSVVDKAGGATRALTGSLRGAGNVSGEVSGVTRAVGGVTGAVGGVTRVAGGGASHVVGGVTGVIGCVTRSVGGGVTHVVGGVTRSVGGVTRSVGGVTRSVGAVAKSIGGVTVGGVTRTVGGVTRTVGAVTRTVGGVAKSVGGATASVGGVTRAVAGVRKAGGDATDAAGAATRSVGGLTGQVGGVTGAVRATGGAASTSARGIGGAGGVADTLAVEIGTLEGASRGGTGAVGEPAGSTANIPGSLPLA